MGNCSRKPDTTIAHIIAAENVLGINIMEIHTTGATGTAEENKLKVTGVAASEEMARRYLAKIKPYLSVIKYVAEERSIDPALIAAIISRDRIKMKNNPEETLRGITNHLADCIRDICFENRGWTVEQQFKGGIAAYKVGVRRVCSYNDVDEYTPGEDYSNDVVARAQWFKRNIDF